jgi:hypothetical protein
MKFDFTLEEIEKWRDRSHRRTPGRAIHTRAQALRFINETGFCFAFKSVHSELPCLWHAAVGERDPAMPVHTHHDPGISFVWEMKNVLPAERKVYYGKVLKRRPTFVSLEMFPFFYALTRRTGSPRDHEDSCRRGEISPLARDLVSALHDSSPQLTRGLKLSVSRMAKEDRPEFDRAMAELQARMFVVKVAEQYEPFSFEWDLVRRTFAAEVRKARSIQPDRARIQILERYFRVQLVGSVTSISRLFGWERQHIFRALGNLVDRGIIAPNVRIDSRTTRQYCLVDRRRPS